MSAKGNVGDLYLMLERAKNAEKNGFKRWRCRLQSEAEKRFLSKGLDFVKNLIRFPSKLEGS